MELRKPDEQHRLRQRYIPKVVQRLWPSSRFLAPRPNHSSYRISRCLSNQSKEYVPLYLLYCHWLRYPNHTQLSQAMTTCRLKHAVAGILRKHLLTAMIDAAAGPCPRPLNSFRYVLVRSKPLIRSNEVRSIGGTDSSIAGPESWNCVLI